MYVSAFQERSIPAFPRFVVADDVGGVTVMLQEFVAGAVSDEVSDQVVRTLLSLNELQEGQELREAPTGRTTSPARY